MYEPLTEKLKNQLIDIIVESYSYDLPHLDFTVELGDLIEDIPGMEMITELEYDDLVLELSELYSTRKVEYYKRNSGPFVDL